MNIIISNLSKRYKRLVVYENFNYEINKNLFLMMGPNGSGKTTLLNCLANYIRFKGTITGINSFSYLPETRGFDDDVKVIDMINLFQRMHGTNVDSYIEQFQFRDHLKKRIVELSKGNLTKLFLLCTLAKPADIYIFDEPTDGLDIAIKKEFVNFCKELSKDKGVIVSTHDLGIIDSLSLTEGVQVLDLTKR